MKELHKRWIYVVAGVVILLLLGLIYAWSIFVAPLEKEFSWSRSETSIAFTICMSMFCIGGLVAGFLAKKKTPGFIIRCCGVLVCLGFVFTSYIHSLSGLYISYGVLVGFGVGLAYNAIISSVTKWFPEKTGFISGLLLMGFGFGGMVLGTVSTSIIGDFGWRNAFVGIGVVLGVCIIIGSFFIKVPITTKEQTKSADEGLAPQEINFGTKEMLSTSTFWMYFAWTVSLSAAGLAMIGHAAPCAIDLGISASQAAIYTGLISLCNGFGRVFTGFIYDKIGQKKTMAIVSIGFILTGIVLTIALHNNSFTILIVGYILTGFSYGGIMPCNSSIISNFYGRNNYAMNFSMINMNIILASMLGPFLAGVLQTASGSYLTTFLTMIVFGIVAFILNLVIKKPHKKEAF